MEISKIADLKAKGGACATLIVQDCCFWRTCFGDYAVPGCHSLLKILLQNWLNRYLQRRRRRPPFYVIAAIISRFRASRSGIPRCLEITGTPRLVLSTPGFASVQLFYSWLMELSIADRTWRSGICSLTIFCFLFYSPRRLLPVVGFNLSLQSQRDSY